LIKDSVYCFSAHLRLSPGSRYATNAFGFLMSKERQFIDTDEVLTVRPSKHLNTQVLNYKSKWMKVQCTYKAEGGERFLTLGSFQNHKEEKDSLSLDSTVLETITPFDTLKKGDKIILDNIHFDNDESRLLAESYSTLFELLTFMRSSKSLKIEIAGHTSSLGRLTHNKVLSLRRANAVMKFLTNNGIEEDRIETIGHGPDFPIADNETKEGQRENRRVEFKILKL